MPRSPSIVVLKYVNLAMLNNISQDSFPVRVNHRDPGGGNEAEAVLWLSYTIIYLLIHPVAIGQQPHLQLLHLF